MWYEVHFVVNKPFEVDGISKTEVSFYDHDNARAFAKKMTTCADVIGDVCVLNGTTGEVLDIYVEGESVYTV